MLEHYTLIENMLSNKISHFSPVSNDKSMTLSGPPIITKSAENISILNAAHYDDLIPSQEEVQYGLETLNNLIPGIPTSPGTPDDQWSSLIPSVRDANCPGNVTQFGYKPNDVQSYNFFADNEYAPFQL